MYFVFFLQNVPPSQFRYYVSTVYDMFKGANYTYARKISKTQMGQIILALSSDLCYNSYHNIKFQPIINLWLKETY